jgi:hypothetical protein
LSIFHPLRLIEQLLVRTLRSEWFITNYPKGFNLFHITTTEIPSLKIILGKEYPYYASKGDIESLELGLSPSLRIIGLTAQSVEKYLNLVQ